MVDIKRLALLARIKLTAGEEEKLQNEFEEILNYISKLKEADIRNIDAREAIRTTDLENITREDKEPYEPGMFSSDLLKEAPATKGGYVKVKHVFE